QPPLQRFYDLLNEEQKARLNALGQDQRDVQTAKNGGNSISQNCGVAQSGVTGWPSAEIDARVHPTEAQRASLAALQDATAKAAAMPNASCQPRDAIAPPPKLDPIGKQLDVTLQVARIARAAS